MSSNILLSAEHAQRISPENSGPTRYWKGLQRQLIGLCPFQTLVPEFQSWRRWRTSGISSEVEDGGLELFSKRWRVVGDLSRETELNYVETKLIFELR